MGDPVVTRVEFAGPPRRARDLQERLMVRFPNAWRRIAAAVQRRLSPRSRLRRELLRREMTSAYAAVSRRDFELMLVRYSPEVDVEFEPDLEALGFEGPFHGHDGFLRLIDAFGEAWEHWQVLPSFLIDAGDRFVGLGRFQLPGTASGVELEREFAQVLEVRNGLIVAEREFFDWDKGLRAAGLDPGGLALPRLTQLRSSSAASPAS